jgi:hypothetical protein
MSASNSAEHSLMPANLLANASLARAAAAARGPLEQAAHPQVRARHVGEGTRSLRLGAGRLLSRFRGKLALRLRKTAGKRRQVEARGSCHDQKQRKGEKKSHPR